MLVTMTIAMAKPYSQKSISIIKLTYLGDAIEHNWKKQVGAIGLLSCFSFVLEEGELALDAVPDWHLIDVVDEDKGVEWEDEVLHAVDWRQEHFL